MHREERRDGRVEKKSIFIPIFLTENLSNFSMTLLGLVAIIPNTTVSVPRDFILMLNLGHRC